MTVIPFPPTQETPEPAAPPAFEPSIRVGLDVMREVVAMKSGSAYAPVDLRAKLLRVAASAIIAIDDLDRDTAEGA